MARREVRECDGCGKVDPPGIKSFFFPTGRSMDPSGNSYEDEGENVDLCPDCMEFALNKFLDYNWENNQEVHTSIRDHFYFIAERKFR